MIDKAFFERDTLLVARELIGKILYRRYEGIWLSARIIETEAYRIDDRASHSSLGYTEKRAALFMPPGTIYMYYSRAGDSLCVSTEGDGNSVLIKSAIACPSASDSTQMIDVMQKLNPPKGKSEKRNPEKLCSGQTLLCRSLNLKVTEWDKRQFDRSIFYLDDDGYKPAILINTARLGIRADRDSHLLYRYVDKAYSNRSTKDILKDKTQKPELDYFFIEKN